MSARFDAFIDQPTNPHCDIVSILTKVFNDIEEHGIAPDVNFNEGWMCPLYNTGDKYRFTDQVNVD